MILFIHEDDAFRHWITHHRQGFVLDGVRKPRLGHLVLHRATCPEVKEGAKHVHATSGRRLKGCSLDSSELQAWCVEETEKGPTICVTCMPLSEVAAGDDPNRHLTRGEHDILDYVLDVALIHLEPDALPYRLTVGDIAHCLRKTPGQLAVPLNHLIAAGMLVAPGRTGVYAVFSPRQAIFPTVAALQTLPAFAAMAESAVVTEVARLSAE